MTDQEGREGSVKRRNVSRRDLIRRGAIIGGTLIWTVPVIRTLSTANAAPGSPSYTCCECRNGGGADGIKCDGNGGLECFDTSEDQSLSPVQNTAAYCQQYCADRNKGYCFKTSPTPLQCVSDACTAA